MSESFLSDFEQQSLRTLYRKMKKTAMARFNCARRLQWHQKLALWSLSFFSAGLIGLTLISALKIHTNLSEAHFNFLQIALALFVLVLSLLLSANNYSDRAEKMHRCGLELNALCHQILPDCKDMEGNPDRYREVLSKYTNALNSYENHASIDFDLVMWSLSDEYNLGFWNKLQICFKYALGFISYIALTTILLGSFYILFFPKPDANANTNATNISNTLNPQAIR